MQEPCTSIPKIEHSLSKSEQYAKRQRSGVVGDLQDSVAIPLRVLLSSTYP